MRLLRNKIGTIMVRVSGIVVIITLATMLTVASATPATVTSSGPNSGNSSETATVTFTVTNTGSNESGYILDVSLPDGWNESTQSGDGGTWNSAEKKWLWQAIDPSKSVTPSITVQIPDEVNEKNYSVNATLKSVDGVEDTTTHIITIQDGTVPTSSSQEETEPTSSSQEETEPTSSSQEETEPTSFTNNGSLGVNLTVSPSEVESGETVTVTSDLTNTGETNSAYILDLSIPSNWTIVDNTNDGGTWKPSENSWLWQTVSPGESVSPSVTVKVPSSSSKGTYDLKGTARSTDEKMTTNATILITSSDNDGDSDHGDGSDDTGVSSFTISRLNPQNATITAGDTLTVTATIENVGNASGTQAVEYRIGGSTIANETVTLPPGENTTVEFTEIETLNLVADDYEHGVFTEDFNQTGTLTIEGDANGGTDNSAPGFGSVASLLALVLFVLLTRRERD